MKTKDEKFRLLSKSRLVKLCTKAKMDKITQMEILIVFGHIAVLEAQLDEMDYEDTFGTEGWRHFIGIPEN